MTEIVPVGPNDVVFFASDQPDRVGANDVETLLQRARSKVELAGAPGITRVYRYRGIELPVEVTLAEAFATMTMLYLLGGTAAQRSFLAENFETDLSELSPTDRAADAFLLPFFEFAVDEIEELAAESVATIQPLAVEAGIARLDEARHQIADEAERYLDLRMVAGIRFDDLPRSGLRLRTGSSDVDMLAATLATVKPISERVDRAAVEWRREVDRAVLADFSSRPTRIGDKLLAPPPAQGAADVISAIRAVEDDPVVSEAKTTLLAAQTELAEFVMTAGVDMPVIWRLYRSTSALDDLDQATAKVLQRAWAANDETRTELGHEPEMVWRFRPLIIDALDGRHHHLGSSADNTHVPPVPRLSVARTAALERVERPVEDSLIDELLGLTGLASVGLLAAAGIAGGAILSGPVALSVWVADAVLSMAHADETLRSAFKASAAYDAALDPRLALGNQPDWLSTAAVVLLDLTAVIP